MTDRSPSTSLEALTPTGGSLYAHVFENRATGIPRGLYWALSVDFEPFANAGESWDCSIQCDWMTWNVKRWTEVDGLSLSDMSAPDLVESSLYLVSHQLLRLESLRIRKQAGTEFEASLDARGNIELPDGQLHRSTLISLEVSVSFGGIYVVPDNLFPKPANEDDVARIVEPFISVDDFVPPVRDRFRFVLSPRATAR